MGNSAELCQGWVSWGQGKAVRRAQGVLGHRAQTLGLGSCLQHGPVVDLPVPFEGGWEMLKLCLMSRVKAATLLGVAPEC